MEQTELIFPKELYEDLLNKYGQEFVIRMNIVCAEHCWRGLEPIPFKENNEVVWYTHRLSYLSKEERDKLFYSTIPITP